MNRGNNGVVLASVAFAAAMPLVALAVEVTYVPQSGDGPWEWSETGNWYTNSSSAASQAPLLRLPTKNDNLLLYNSSLTSAPLRVSAGTSAACRDFYIGANEYVPTAAGDTPIMFEVCGGTLTNALKTWLGYYGNNGASKRSAKVGISSGRWTSLGDFHIGGGTRMSWLDIGENGVLEVPTNGFFAGFSSRGGATVTNKGSVTVKDMHLGWNYSWTNGDKGNTTGIVVNAGTVNVTNNLAVGDGPNSYGHFENNGTLTVGYDMYVGNTNGSTAKFENRGTISVGHDLLLGRDKGVSSELVNYGTITCGRRFRIGCASGGTTAVYRHMPGASFVKNIDESDGYQALYVGMYSPGVLSVDGGDLDLPSNALSQNRVFVAAETKVSGLFEVKNGGSFHFGGTAFTVGFGSYSTGTLHIDGQGSRMYGNGWLNVGNWWSYNSNAVHGDGKVIVSNGAELDMSAIYLGFGGCAHGSLIVTNGATVKARDNLTIAHLDAGSKGGVTGVVVVAGSNSTITNVNKTAIGRTGINNFGLLKMEGGRYFFKTDSNSEFHLGMDGSSSIGEIRGWGLISHHWLGEGQGTSRAIYMTHYGKVIADGEGEERDLDMRFMWSLAADSADPNVIGCNGWYARNKGRLRMPILYAQTKGFTKCVGEYEKYAGDPRLVNSFKITFDDMYTSTRFLWCDLYAPDRTDIPAGLASSFSKGKVLVVYRIGYFDNGHHMGEPDSPLTWRDAKIKFHYDPDAASEYSRVRVFRHDGTAGGAWSRVGAGDVSTSSPFVETAKFARITSAPPSGAIWNVGWFAIVAKKESGFSVTFR